MVLQRHLPPPPQTYQAYLITEHTDPSNPDATSQDATTATGQILSATENLILKQCGRWELEKEYEEY